MRAYYQIMLKKLQVLLKYSTLNWVENSLLSSQHHSNGKSPTGWHNFEASFLLSLKMELLMSQEQAPTKDVIKRKGFSHVVLRIGPP
jgi:hypothetical protein